MNTDFLIAIITALTLYSYVFYRQYKSNKDKK